MKGKFIMYALLVSLGTTLVSWTQFFASLGGPSGKSNNSWTPRTGTGAGTWGNGTGGTTSGSGHK
jgi:hypothetical protein